MGRVTIGEMLDGECGNDKNLDAGGMGTAHLDTTHNLPGYHNELGEIEPYFAPIFCTISNAFITC